ncbi:MAG: hypothetical protein HY719_15930 [Planctomycetes bacterium]|nr:hypothetical protein [Planctomycetota bacterium]
MRRQILGRLVEWMGILAGGAVLGAFASQSEPDAARRWPGACAAATESVRETAASVRDEPERMVWSPQPSDEATTPAGAPAARALQEAPAPAATSPEANGNEFVKGTVRTQAYEPLAGVRVRIRPDLSPPENRGGQTPVRAIEGEATSALLDRIHQRYAWARETTTDRDGRFRFERLPFGWTVVEPRLAGFAFRSGGQHSQARVKTSAVLDFIACAVATLDVDIVLPDGSRPPDADIVLEDRDQSSNQRSHSWTTESPRLPLEPGRWSMRVRGQLPDGTGFNGWKEEIAAPTEGTATKVRIEAVLQADIWGHVDVAAGLQPGEVTVACRATGGSSDGVEPPDVNYTRCVSVSRSEGYQFRFENLAPGAYEVGAAYRCGVSDDGVANADSDWTSVTLGARSVRCEIRLPEIVPPDYLLLRVTDSTGAPAPDARVSTYRLSSDSAERDYRDQREEPIPCADGSVWYPRPFEGSPSDDEERVRGAAVLWVDAGASGEAVVDCPPGTRRLHVRAQKPAEVNVVIDGYNAEAARGTVRVHVVPARQDLCHWARDEGSSVVPSPENIDSDGQVRVRYPLRGQVEVDVLVVSSDAYGTRHSWRYSHPASVHGESCEIHVPMPRLHTLSLRNVPASAQQVVAASNERETPYFVRRGNKDESGTWTMTALPEGQYRVQVETSETVGNGDNLSRARAMTVNLFADLTIPWEEEGAIVATPGR